MIRNGIAPAATGDDPAGTADRWLRWVGIAAAAGVLAAAVVLALHPIATTDFFWQLRAGDSIRHDGAVPRTDAFSYTAEGRPWIDLHWGFQWILSILYGWIGTDGLNLVRALLVGVTFGLLLFGFRRGRIGTIGLAATLVAVLASHERFLVRPEIVSFLLLAVFLILLERGIRSVSDPVCWVPIGLMVVWVNVHSLFVLGLALLALATAGEWIDLVRRRWRSVTPLRADPPGRETLLTLALVTAAGSVACLLNPFGWRAFSLPVLQFTGRIAAGNPYSGSIAEFQQPFDAGVGTFAVAAFWILAAAVGAVLLWRGGRLPSRQVLIAAAFFLLAWRARRNLPLFALVAVPLLVEAARGLRGSMRPRRWTRSGSLIARVAVLGLALAVAATVCSGRFYVWERMDRRFGSGVLAGIAPSGAADFISGRSLGGRIFHTLDDGGYLIWRLYPEYRVFIDGRLEVYDEATFTAYLQVLEDPRGFEALAENFGIRSVLWNHSKALIGNRLLRHLIQSPGWYPVYVDSVSILFRRPDAGAAAGEPGPIDLGTATPAAVLERGAPTQTPLDRILTGWTPRRRETFLSDVRLGIVFAILGQMRQAEAFLLRATAAPGAPPEVHFDLGLVYDRLGLAEKAILEYEEARHASGPLRDPLGWLFRPGFRRDLRLRLGSAYIRAGMEDRGIPILERSGPRGRARLLAIDGFKLQQQGRPENAVDKYREALELDPDSPEIFHNLGLALIAVAVQRLDAGKPHEALVEEAAAAFRKAIAARPGFASAHFNLGLLLVQDGRPQEAAEAFGQAVALEPDNAGFRFQLGFALLQAGRTREAISALSEAVRLRPNFPPARYHLGVALLGAGEVPEALKAFQAAFDQGMTDSSVTLQLARVHARLGETDEALRWLRRTGMTAAELRGLLNSIPELAPLVDRLESETGPSPR